MLIQSTTQFDYDEQHYTAVAQLIRLEGQHQRLIATLSSDELLNHISMVAYTFDRQIEIHVGKTSRIVQGWMRSKGMSGIVGMTPKNPIQNPKALPQENANRVREFERKLQAIGMNYIPCYGRARDFRQGGDGCFLLLNCEPSQAMTLLLEDDQPSQLSITYLPSSGLARLVSCIE